MSTAKTKNLTEGPIFSQLLLFGIPLMLTGMLQLLYNLADHVVVGKFSGDPYALAAVGTTAALTNITVNLLLGVSAGACVIVAQSFGADDKSRLERAVHTAISFSLLGGIVTGAIVFLIARPALTAMGTSSLFIDKSVLYMQIIALGIPASAVYNFGAGVLRSVGDSKTPLYILSATGILNVVLNMVFVIGFGMSVDGVAIATIASQYMSAIVVIFVLIKRKSEPYRLKIRQLKIDGAILAKMLRFGIPAGMQTSLFSISNMLLTVAVNTFPPTTVTAKTISGNIDGFLYVILQSYHLTSMTFTAQNYGARRLDRVKKSTLYSLLQVTLIGVTLGLLISSLGEVLAKLFIESGSPDTELIVERVMEALNVTVRFYFLCGIMETVSGTLRGLGYSLSPMILTIGGICGLRILWIIAFFPMEAFNSLGGLYLCYPISWSVTALVLSVLLISAYRKAKLQFSDTPKI